MSPDVLAHVPGPHDSPAHVSCDIVAIFAWYYVQRALVPELGSSPPQQPPPTPPATVTPLPDTLEG